LTLNILIRPLDEYAVLIAIWRSGLSARSPLRQN